MQNKTTLVAASLVLAAAFISGCAPSTNPQAQAGSTTGAYGTTASYGGTTGASGTDYGSTAGSQTGGAGYGASTGAATGGSSGSYYDYSAPSSTGSSYSGGGSSYGGGYSSGGGSGYSSGGTGGSYAVQVVATQNRSTAEAMRSQMQSQGFNAVVDSVGGMYKVRVPFSSESEAKASLSRIRSSVSDAFYTMR